MSETPTPPTGSSFGYRAPPPRRRPAWRTWVWIGVAIVVAIVVALLMGSLAKSPAGGPGGARAGAGARGGRGGGGGRVPTVVGVATAVKGDIPLTLSALGTVTSEATVTVNTQIAGTLTKVDFKEGQIVRKGQLLAEVDTRPYVVALAQAEGQLARDQATLVNAKLDLSRYETLKTQDSISGQQVDTQASTVKQDEGVVKSDQAAAASAKLNLVYCHIIAPVSGRVGLRQVDAGNYITAGLTNGLVIITQIDPIDVVFSLPEDTVPAIQARIAKGAVLPVTALDRTGAVTLGTGTLSTLDNQIDTTTGTIKGKAKFSNPNGTLFPNQFVNVNLLVDTLKDVVVVPTAAVRHGANGDYAFVLDQDPMSGANVGRMVQIKVGPSQGDRSSIASGIKVGDQLITDGGDRLTDGGTVLLPGQIPPSFGPKTQKPTGFFGWIAGLFGHKPAADASAAGGAGAGGAGGGRAGGAARMQAMLDQLGLTPDQKAKIDAIQADQKTKIAAAGDDPDARRAAMRDGFTKINAVLTPDQQAKMKALRDAARAAYGGGGGAGGGGSPGGATPGAAAGADSSANTGAATAASLNPSPVAPPPSAPASSAPAAAPSGDGGGRHGGAAGGGAGGPGGPGTHGPGGGGGGMFAILDDDQKAKAKAIMDDARASGDFSGVRAKIDAILRPDQKAKLAQMRAAREAAGGGSGGGGGGQ